MNELVDTTEMYLRTIYDLEEEGVTPLRARIAERLDQIGKLFGLSRERVRQIEREVMTKLRNGERADRLRSYAS